VKKTFLLHVEGKHPARLLESIKHEIRKYIERERRKELPKGSDVWYFDCRVGASDETAAPVRLNEINAAIDAVVAEAAPSFFIELTARAAVHPARGPSSSAIEVQGD